MPTVFATHVGNIYKCTNLIFSKANRLGHISKFAGAGHYDPIWPGHILTQLLSFGRFDVKSIAACARLSAQPVAVHDIIQMIVLPKGLIKCIMDVQAAVCRCMFMTGLSLLLAARPCISGIMCQVVRRWLDVTISLHHRIKSKNLCCYNHNNHNITSSWP